MSEEIVKKVISEHRYIHEHRLNNIMFLSELEYIKRTGERLTEFVYDSYRHGVYSEDLIETADRLCEEDKVKKMGAFKVGMNKSRYATSEDLGNVPKRKLEVIDRVMNENLSESNKDLEVTVKNKSIHGGNTTISFDELEN